MYSEIKIVCKGQLPNNLQATLTAFFNAPDSVIDVLNESKFSNIRNEISQQCIYQKIVRDDGYLYIVFNPSVNAIKIHIESLYAKSDINGLKKNVMDTIQHLNGYFKQNRIKVREFKVLIYAENSYLLTGKFHNWGQRFWNLIRTDWISKVFVPVATFFASYLLTEDYVARLFNAIVAAVALLLWMIIASIKGSKKLIFNSEV